MNSEMSDKSSLWMVTAVEYQDGKAVRWIAEKFDRSFDARSRFDSLRRSSSFRQSSTDYREIRLWGRDEWSLLDSCIRL